MCIESCALTSPEQLGAGTSLQMDLELNGLEPARVGQDFQRQLSLVAHSLKGFYCMLKDRDHVKIFSQNPRQ